MSWYQCESCGLYPLYNPEHTESFEGYGGEIITLAFCSSCYGGDKYE